MTLACTLSDVPPPVVGQLFVVDMRHLDKDIHPVEERPADAPLVARHQAGGAGALAEGVAVVAARAGVHRAHQHETGREGDAALGAADGDDLILQRLAQHFQQRVAELRQLIEEEDAAVAEADLARLGKMPAAHQPGVGDGVVGRAERALPDQRRIRGQQAADAVNLGDLQGFIVGHGGQYGRQRARQQGLAAARRPAHDHVVPPGGGHLQSALNVFLALDIRQVGELMNGAAAASAPSILRTLAPESRRAGS